MSRKAAVFGTFDTKGREFLLLKEILKENGIDSIMIDTGLGDNPYLTADYTVRQMLLQEGETLPLCSRADDRAKCLDMVAVRTGCLICDMQKDEDIAGAISMGGGQGTYIAGNVLGMLPIGFPKVLLSTLALIESSAAQFVHLNDTLVLNSIVDIAGINSLLKKTMTEAAGALAGMIHAFCGKRAEEHPAVAISAWGVTTPCVNRVRDYLDERDVEPYVFHSNGEGGRLLETLVGQGAVWAVADITMSEISMPLAGAPLSAVPDRLENSGDGRIPRVAVPGGLDMILARPEDVAEGGKFFGRVAYQHNPEVVFVRSSREENCLFGKCIGEKLNKSRSQVKLLLPLGGLSAIDRESEIFYDPDIDMALFDTLKNTITNPLVEIREIQAHINSEEFAAEVTAELETLLAVRQDKEEIL